MIIQANSLTIPLKDKSVHCVVTSPPYWGLRDYGTSGQLGLEKTPEEYVENTVKWAREVWRVLRKDGTFWLNLGDTYATQSGTQGGPQKYKGLQSRMHEATSNKQPKPENIGLKHKDLCGIPWKVAFALQKSGWYLRSDIIWSKPNPMPESVTDRPTKAHEYLFLLTKSPKYFYDAEAIKEPVTGNAHSRGDGVNPKAAKNPGPNSRIHIDRDPEHVNRANAGIKQNRSFSAAVRGLVSSRNKRTVWTITTQPYPEAHFATFPEKLVEPCIKAGTSERGACPECGAPWERIVEKERLKPAAPSGNTEIERWSKEDAGALGGRMSESKTIGWQPTCKHKADPVPCVVLDPFGGSGTVKWVAGRLGRKAIVIDLKYEYCLMAKKRCVSNQESLNL